MYLYSFGLIYLIPPTQNPEKTQKKRIIRKCWHKERKIDSNGQTIQIDANG